MWNICKFFKVFHSMAAIHPTTNHMIYYGKGQFDNEKYTKLIIFSICNIHNEECSCLYMEKWIGYCSWVTRKFDKFGTFRILKWRVFLRMKVSLSQRELNEVERAGERARDNGMMWIVCLYCMHSQTKARSHNSQPNSITM